jgi:hypothetical protein
MAAFVFVPGHECERENFLPPFLLPSYVRDNCNTDRLAGAGLLAPVINYWWPGFPANLSAEAYRLQFRQDQWTLRVAHYTPWLTYWWNTQKWFPASSIAAQSPDILSPQDKELLRKRSDRKNYVVSI